MKKTRFFSVLEDFYRQVTAADPANPTTQEMIATFVEKTERDLYIVTLGVEDILPLDDHPPEYREKARHVLDALRRKYGSDTGGVEHSNAVMRVREEVLGVGPSVSELLSELDDQGVHFLEIRFHACGEGGDALVEITDEDGNGALEMELCSWAEMDCPDFGRLSGPNAKGPYLRTLVECLLVHCRPTVEEQLADTTGGDCTSMRVVVSTYPGKGDLHIITHAKKSLLTSKSVKLN